jgi:hypothetical protein
MRLARDELFASGLATCLKRIHCHHFRVTVDGFSIDRRIYWILWHSAWLRLTVHFCTHTHTHTHTHTPVPQSFLHCRCLLAASRVRRSPSSGFPNCPRLQIPTSNTTSSPQLDLSTFLTHPSSGSSYIATDGQSVSSSWCRTPFGTYDQILISLSDNYFFILHARRPLWREDGSKICSAIAHWLESRRTHLSHLRLPQPGRPGPRTHVPPWTGWPSPKSKSRYNWRSVSQSVCQGIEPTLGLVTRYYFLSEGCFLKVTVLFLWGALSNAKSGPSFVILSL